MSGHYHCSTAETQNQGNSLGDRACVRQSKLYRQHESGNGMKDALGKSHLSWEVDRFEGAYKGRPVFDHNAPNSVSNRNIDPRYASQDLKRNGGGYNQSTSSNYDRSSAPYDRSAAPSDRFAAYPDRVAPNNDRSASHERPSAHSYDRPSVDVPLPRRNYEEEYNNVGRDELESHRSLSNYQSSKPKPVYQNEENAFRSSRNRHDIPEASPHLNDDYISTLLKAPVVVSAPSRFTRDTGTGSGIGSASLSAYRSSAVAAEEESNYRYNQQPPPVVKAPPVVTQGRGRGSVDGGRTSQAPFASR